MTALPLSPPPTASTGHDHSRLRGLDGLRAVAVGLVVFAHLGLSTGVGPIDVVIRSVPHGGVGVIVFFVLSGFLITWLLLREEADTGRIHLGHFYARRALRILPPAMLYLAAMLVLTLCDVIAIPGIDLLRCLFFARNLYMGPPVQTAHFWSLAVEEQFYLVWPFLLMLLPGLRLRMIATALLIAYSIAHPILFMHLLGRGGFPVLDQVAGSAALLYGCLLALLRAHPWIAGRITSGVLVRWPSALLAVVVIVICSHRSVNLSVIVQWTLLYFAITLLINLVTVTHSRLINRTLNCLPMVWVGQLSYSIYLWQQLFCYREKDTPWLWYHGFPQNLILTLLAAAASFYLLERPMMSLRKRFGSRTAVPPKLATAETKDQV